MPAPQAETLSDKRENGRFLPHAVKPLMEQGGLVERGIPYARERFFKGCQFNGLADMRDQARHWCLEIAGQRVHGTTQRLPLVAFQEEEQAKLLPYDGEPYDIPDWHDATVHRDHHVYYRYALYSAPSISC